MLSLGLGVSALPFLQGGGRALSWATPGAVADYDFKNNRYLGPTLSVTRASSAYVDDSQGNWTLVPANVLRQSDKGLLVEGAQTNSIRNNSMQGAVAGSPGSTPTNWSTFTALTGLARQIVGVGAAQGIDYIDVRVSGTPSAAGTWSIYFDSSTATAAASGQLWTASSFLALVGGSLTGVTSFRQTLSEQNSSGGFLAASTADRTPTPTLTRYALSRTYNNASTATTLSYYDIILTGAAVDFTFRIGWPQLEQWSTSVTTVGGASSPIRTTGTAATRAADVVTATLSRPVTAATMVGVFREPTILPFGAVHVAITDGSLANSYAIRSSVSTPTSGALTGSIGGTGTTNPASIGAMFGNGGRHVPAGAFQANDEAFVVDGGIVGTSVSGGASVSLNTLQLGGLSGSTFNALNGYIERIAVLPSRVSNEQLQTLSTLANWGG